MFRILVVEDDSNTRKLISAILRQEGFEVISVEDGIAALEMMAHAHIDLVVTDVMMPNLDGLELTRELRMGWPLLPILMLTAKQEPLDKRLGFLVGTDDYLTKPFDEQELILRIRALLRRAQIVNDQKLTFGDMTLDYNALSVRIGNELTQLPQKEFYLLFKLLANPNQIFTRLQLMDEIWGLESDTDDHTLNVHINRLRDRFRGCTDFEIVTVRGLGYKAVRHI